MRNQPQNSNENVRETKQTQRGNKGEEGRESRYHQSTGGEHSPARQPDNQPSGPNKNPGTEESEKNPSKNPGEPSRSKEVREPPHVDESRNK